MMINDLHLSLNQIFKRLSISNINYSIDFWSLTFSRHFKDSCYEVKKLNKVVLTAHEIEVCDEFEWGETILNGPFDISDSVDYEEPIKALVLFHLARLPIELVEIEDNADMYFRYANNRFLKIKGFVQVVDWGWCIDIDQNQKVIVSDQGKIVYDEKKLNRVLK